MERARREEDAELRAILKRMQLVCADAVHLMPTVHTEGLPTSFIWTPCSRP